MRFLIALVLLAVPASANAQIGMVEQTLARYDLDTLLPVGPRLTILEPHTGPVLSPDRRLLAIGVSQPGARGLLIVDRATMRPLHRLNLNGASPSIVYPGVVAAAPNDGDRMAVIDPETGRILSRPSLQTFGCDPQGLTIGRRGVFVGALTPGGKVRVTIVGARGRVRRLQISLGTAARTRCSGAKAARAGNRVLIAGPAAVAVLDPATRRVTRHVVPRLGAVRDAEAVPGGLAVVGDNGLSVLSRRSLRVRWRDPRADQVTATRGVAVVIGQGTRGRRAADGHLLWHRGGGRWLSEALRGRVFVDTATRRLVLDALTGRVLVRRGMHYIGVHFAGA